MWDVHDLIARSSVEEDPAGPEEKSTHNSDRDVARHILALDVVVKDLDELSDVDFFKAFELFELVSEDRHSFLGASQSGMHELVTLNFLLLGSHIVVVDVLLRICI